MRGGGGKGAKLTQFPVGAVPQFLLFRDDVPDASQPMSDQGEDEHEQSQDHGAVLRISVHFLEEPGQPKQPRQLQQVHLPGLAVDFAVLAAVHLRGGVQDKVEGESGQQVHREPRSEVVVSDRFRVGHNLTLFADVCRSEVKYYI